MFTVGRFTFIVATIYLFAPVSVVFCSLIMDSDSLRYIRICENQLKMNHLPNNLVAIWINDCGFSSVPHDSFVGSPNVQNISMAHNHLSKLPPNLFQYQSNLMDLDLSYNNITMLDDDIFIGPSQLTVLRLSHNQLTNISSNLVSSLIELRELYLDNNNLHTIHVMAFDETSLQILHLQNNLLTFQDFENAPMSADQQSPFEKLHKLEVLNMRNNSIASFLSDWYAANIALKELDLSHNHLVSINFGQIYQMWLSDIKINVSNNRISTLNYHVPKNENSTSRSVWILNDNPLKCNCAIIQFAEVLQNQAANEHIKFVTDRLKCSTPHRFAGQRLEEVPIAELTCSLDNETVNKINCPQGCSCYVNTFDRTAVFNCSNAGLTKMPFVPNLTKESIKFHELHIENNNITSLEFGNSSSYDHVNRIFAKNNSVEHISAKHLPDKLYALDLSGNKLKRLSSDVLHKLGFTKTLQSISLGQNPFICDCEADGFKSFIEKHMAKMINIGNLICDNGKSTPLTQFKPPLCLVTIVAIAIGTFAVIFIVAIITVALYYKNKLVVKVWLFAYRGIFSWLFNNAKKQDDHTFDAFILYAFADEKFVREELVPRLENGSNQFKICTMAQQGTQAGDIILDQIIDCVEMSRRTVIVLTPNYVNTFSIVNDPSKEPSSEPEDIYGLAGFRLAHYKSLQERLSRVIIIKKGDIGCTKYFQSDLKAYFNANIHLRWNDNHFFNKLSTAIAHPEYFKSKYESHKIETV